MLNEDRLISAIALQRRICGARCGCEYEDCGCEGDCTFDFFISNATTVEAVEVVHGEWEKQQGIYSCSACGKACPYDVQADIIQYWHCNYCPNCGAKMDGE